MVSLIVSMLFTRFSALTSSLCLLRNMILVSKTAFGIPRRGTKFLSSVGIPSSSLRRACLSLSSARFASNKFAVRTFTLILLYSRNPTDLFRSSREYSSSPSSFFPKTSLSRISLRSSGVSFMACLTGFFLSIRPNRAR